jgi:electron transfer flavoprotein beta subunit
MSGFHVVVLVKPVPDPGCYDRVEIDPATGVLARQGMPSVLNPSDRHALEEALVLQERHGGRVTLVSMAPERVLAAGIAKVAPFDLVLAGNESADGGTVHVPSQVGALLGVAHLANVIRLEVDVDGSVRARTRIENGYVEVEGAFPMVLGVRREINTPRYTSLMGVIASQGKPIRVLGAEDLGVDRSGVGMEGSNMRPGKLSRPSYRRKGERVKDDPEEAVARIVGILRAEGVLG